MSTSEIAPLSLIMFSNLWILRLIIEIKTRLLIVSGTIARKINRPSCKCEGVFLSHQIYLTRFYVSKIYGGGAENPLKNTSSDTDVAGSPKRQLWRCKAVRYLPPR